jgi:hypothetical protein
MVKSNVSFCKRVLTKSIIASAVAVALPYHIFIFICSIVFGIPSASNAKPTPAGLQTLKLCLLLFSPHPKYHESHKVQKKSISQDYQHTLLEQLSHQGVGLPR